MLFSLLSNNSRIDDMEFTYSEADYKAAIPHVKQALMQFFTDDCEFVFSPSERPYAFVKVRARQLKNLPDPKDHIACQQHSLHYGLTIKALINVENFEQMHGYQRWLYKLLVEMYKEFRSEMAGKQNEAQQVFTSLISRMHQDKLAPKEIPDQKEQVKIPPGPTSVPSDFDLTTDDSVRTFPVSFNPVSALNSMITGTSSLSSSSAKVEDELKEIKSLIRPVCQTLLKREARSSISARWGERWKKSSSCSKRRN